MQALTAIDGGGTERAERNAASFRGGWPWLGKSLPWLSSALALPSSEATAALLDRSVGESIRILAGPFPREEAETVASNRKKVILCKLCCLYTRSSRLTLMPRMRRIFSAADSVTIPKAADRAKTR